MEKQDSFVYDMDLVCVIIQL